MKRRELLGGAGALALLSSTQLSFAGQAPAQVVGGDPFALPPLPYAVDALEPHISRETMEFHHGKHHKAYLDNLRGMVAAGSIKPFPLKTLIAFSRPGTVLHNNAAQAWNHEFFWNCLSPQGGGEPTGPLLTAINKSFGSTKAFNDEFRKAALSNFGSGWTWLVKRRGRGGDLEIVNTSNAEIPRGDPLLTLDVWEHAYYIDYRNGRAKFVDAYLNSLVNWHFAADNFRD